MVFRQTDLKRRALNVRKYVGSDVTRVCSFLFFCFKHKLMQFKFYNIGKSL